MKFKRLGSVIKKKKIALLFNKDTLNRSKGNSKDLFLKPDKMNNRAEKCITKLPLKTCMSLADPYKKKYVLMKSANKDKSGLCVLSRLAWTFKFGETLQMFASPCLKDCTWILPRTQQQ